MNFQQFKMQIMALTGLEKDALHIYVGLGVFCLSLLLTQPILKRQLTRLNIALIMAIIFAFAGEYLDLRYLYPHLKGIHLEASIHDLINTCFWPAVLYALNRWTSIFQREEW